ncbi:MAG: 3'-5' exonuclease [Malacoplasma sp.]
MEIKDNNIIFLDIEADPEKEKLLQFGAIKVSNNEIEHINIFSNPQAPISKHVLKLIGKNLNKINGGIPQTEIAEKIKTLFENTTIVSYGDFDYIFLKKFLKKEINYEIKEKFINLQEHWKNLTESKNFWSLDKICDFFQIEIVKDNLHDAFYDASLLYECYKKWNQSSDEKKLKEKIVLYNLNFDNKITKKINKSNGGSCTIDNLTKINGLIVLDLIFTKLNNKDKIWILTSLNIIEVQSNILKRNWSFYYDINDYDENVYNPLLISALKNFFIFTRKKKILIKENIYGHLVRLINICCKKVNMFPLNEIIFTEGFETYNECIDFTSYEFDNNLDLIKNWLIYEYLKNV